MSRVLLSLKYASMGLFNTIRYERNFRLMWICATLVFFLNGIFSFNYVEQLSFLVAISLVLTSELFNGAIEKLCNLYSHEKNKIIRIIKDASAGAVLILSISALVLFLIIIFKNFSFISPWLFSLSSLDFILFFVFAVYQSIKGKSSFIDALSSVFTLIFMFKDFKNISFMFLGLSTFIIWQLALILNSMDVHAFFLNFRKNRSSL